MKAADWALIAALALVFAPGVMAMAEVWSSVDYYSHGFLVPVVAYWGFHQNARRLRIGERDARGFAVLGGALLLYALGLAAGVVTLQGLGVVAAVAGVVVRLWGPRGLKRLAFPVGFLVFMVPLPEAVLTPLIVELQLWVSVVSVELLHAVGFAVAREGNVVLLPGGGSLFVAEACSGITSIVTLAPLGVVLAYFTEKTWGRRLLIVAAVVPVAMFGNLLRVLGTVVVADAYGVERATKGALHESAGLLTFVFACLLLIGVGPLLRLLSRHGQRLDSRSSPA